MRNSRYVLKMLNEIFQRSGGEQIWVETLSQSLPLQPAAVLEEAVANVCQLVTKPDGSKTLELLEKDKLRRTRRAPSFSGDLASSAPYGLLPMFFLTPS